MKDIAQAYHVYIVNSLKKKVMETEYEFGKALRQILKERDIKQIELADKTGLAKSYISELLNSKRNPEMDTLNKICNSLDISLNYFVLLSFKTLNRDREKYRLLEQIKPLLFELDELIYPENYNRDKSPSRPIGVNANRKNRKAVQTI